MVDVDCSRLGACCVWVASLVDVDCSRLEACCVWVASLVDVIYRPVGMCSGAWRVLFFLLGKKIYRVMSCL